MFAFAIMLSGLLAFRNHPVNLRLEKEMVVVVDAGHGGFDPGAKSPDQQWDESTMSLALAKLMQTIAPEYGIRVVLTRENNHALVLPKRKICWQELRRPKKRGVLREYGQ